MHRSGYLVWHRRLALLFAPLMLLQALTGAVLLFRDQFGGLSGPALAAGPVQPLDRIYAAAAATGKQVQRLYMPTAPGRSVLVQLGDADGTRSFALIDPATARVVRQGGLAAFPAEGALQLHYRLLAGNGGLVLVGMGGIALLVMAGTGLVFWWPGKGRWGQSLKINRRMPSRIRLRHWHRSFGVVAAVLVACSAATGALIAGNDAIAAFFAPAPVAPSTVEIPPDTESIDPARVAAGVQLAQAAFPHAGLRDLRFPAGGRMDVNLLAPERNALAVHIVSVDLGARQIVRTVPAQDNPALWMKLLPYHSGAAFGLAGKLALLIEALVLVGLGLTGPVMWWQQRKLRK